MKPVIFLGPTISHAEAESILVADYRPPAALADIWRAARADPPAIGIIDGYFHSIPSVWHKEILWAIQKGIAVFGAASMGALRAAELSAFGMIGVGRIFEAYASGELEDDDDVALAHADAAHGFRPHSEPMVNMRATLARAVDQGFITDEIRRRLEVIAKALYYPDRIWPEVLRCASREEIDKKALRGFEAWLPTNRVDQKRVDAVALLEAVAAHISSEHKQTLNFCFEETVLWRTLLAREEAADDRAVIVELTLEPELFERVLPEARIYNTTVLDTLRKEGAYEHLLARAHYKRKIATLLPHRSLPDRESLIRWFFETRLGGWPDDLPSFVRTRGWVNEEILADVAEREYLIFDSGPTSGL